jgi:Uma2 family endonuclease
LNLDGWESIPDVCVFPKDALALSWIADQDIVSTTPSLVIEVLSPKQSSEALVDKMREYLKHGVKSCWIVAPYFKSISLFPQSGPSRTIVEGVIRDEDLDIEVRIDDVFSLG